MVGLGGVIYGSAPKGRAKRSKSTGIRYKRVHPADSCDGYTFTTDRATGLLELAWRNGMDESHGIPGSHWVAICEGRIGHDKTRDGAVKNVLKVLGR